jgi:hypothetical protein
MNSHDEIVTKSRAVFEHSVATLDVATANRLRLMRRDTLSQQAPNRFKAFFIPVSATLAVVLGIAIFLPPFQATQNVTEQDAIYISAEEDTDSELVDWLADAPVEVSSHLQGSL